MTKDDSQEPVEDDAFAAWCEGRGPGDVPVGFTQRVMSALPESAQHKGAPSSPHLAGVLRAAAALLAISAGLFRLAPLLQLIFPFHSPGGTP